MTRSPGPVALRRAGAADRGLLERLVQLEQHDLSDITGELPDDEGLFPVRGLDRFLDEPGGAAYVVEVGGGPAGFALVRPVDATSFLHSFFVVRSLRRRGVGAQAAALLLATEEGPWTIAVVERYTAAVAFWRSVVAASGRSAAEDRRDHGGETFVWLVLDSLG